MALINQLQITHHGAIDGVTGSCHRLALPGGDAVLVDCGPFQGAETSGDGAGAGRLEISFDISTVRALLVMHVHIDHVGRIPYLLAAGFKGPIFCSEASALLLPMVLQDALEVGFTQDKALISRVIAQLKKQIIPLPYKAWNFQFQIGRTQDVPSRLQAQAQTGSLGLGRVGLDVRIVHRDDGAKAASTTRIQALEKGIEVVVP